MNSITLLDIAKRVGVSTAAVSIALNKGDTNRVSAKTRQKILKVAEELRYAPNELARALAENKTRLVGLVAPIGDPIFFHHFISQALSGIQSTLMRRGYNLLVYSPSGRKGLGVREKIHESKYTDGIIFINTRSCSSRTVSETIRDLQAARTKFCMMNSYDGREPINYVGVDEKAIGTTAAEYLVARGHRRIAFLSGAHVLPAHRQLVSGMERVLSKHGSSLPDELIACTEYDREQTYAMLDRWFRLSSGRRPTAIVVLDDHLLSYLYDYVELREMSIPQDFSVLARRNIGIEDHLRPRPTSISVPSFQMGQQAADLLIDTIENSRCEPRRMIMPVELIEGTTVLRKGAPRG